MLTSPLATLKVAGFSIQFLILVTGTPTAEFVVTIVALPVILAFLLLTAVSSAPYFNARS